MKPTIAILTIATTLLTITGCKRIEEHPLLMCDFADARETVSLEILLHDPDGDRTCSMKSDEYGIFSFRPEFTGDFAEIEFNYDGREYGVVLQRHKHVKMVIANGNPIFSCDNKECNETCEAIRRIYCKDNFIHSENSPASYEEKSERLLHSSHEVRLYIASVSDNDLRERLSRRAERLHREYSEVIAKLKTPEDREEYNRAIVGISLTDDFLILPSSSIIDAYASTR